MDSENEQGGNVPPAEAAGSTETTSTPLPYRKLGALVVVLMNESISASMLFPFIGFFVAHLSHSTNDEAGYASGLLVSMFMFGQFLSGKLWGRVSDVMGRRPVLLCSLFLSSCVMFCFGFSSSIPMAMCLRFIHGFVNGNVGVAKVYVMEITDKTNESKGMATVSLSWNSGCVLGPFLGGVLYDPATTGLFGSVGEDSLFYNRPAVLPCMVIASYTMMAFLISLKTLPETCERAEPFTLSRFAVVWKEQFCAMYLSTNKKTPDAEDATSSELVVEVDEASGKEVPVKPLPTLTYKSVFAHPVLRVPVILYVLMSAADFGCFEVTPLWLMASRGTGGLGLTAAQIGYVVLGTGIVTILSNLVYPKMVETLYPTRLQFWQWACLMWALTVGFTPFATECLSYPYAVAMVVVLTIARGCFQSWIFSTVFLFIAMVTPRDQLGVMNGIAQSCGSLLRATMPVVLTPLFAVSLEYKYPPLMDHYTAFLFISAILVYCYRTSLGAKMERA